MFTSTFLHRFLATYQSHVLLIVLLLMVALALRWLPYWAVLLQRRQGSARIDPGLRQKETLEWTYRLRYVILSTGGLSLAIALSAIAEAAGAWANSPHRAHLTAIALWLGAVVLMGFSLEEGLAPWFIPWFRDAAWNLARLVAPLRKRLRDLWLWAILALVVTGIAVRLLPLKGLNTSLDSWLLPMGAVLIGLALLRMAFQARRRLVIQPFADPSDDESLKGLGASLAIRLRHELSRMQSLYETVDEVLPESEQGNLSLSMHVEDIGAIFKEAIGPDSKIAIGPVKIPIGAIVSALSLFVSGPRITGSLHREGTGLALLAEISGGGQSGCWKVNLEDRSHIEATLREEDEAEEEERVLSPSSPKEAEGIVSDPAKDKSNPPKANLSTKERRELDLLVRLLACRIFTDLVPSGSPRWQAVHHFTAGLRAYRETQRTTRDKTVHLRRAEREFLRALSDDNNFVLCQCDLGVVYGELGMKTAEEAALRQALADNPHAVDACLGLAVRSHEKERYPSAVRHCENALRVQADRPEIWHLLGVAKAAQASQEASSVPAEDEAGSLPSPQIAGSSRHCFEISTALAWRILFRVSWSGRPTLIKKHRSLASFCLTELARYQYEGNEGDQSELSRALRTRRACRLFRQALRLGDDSSWIAFELGRALFENKQWKEAEVAFARIFNDGLSYVDRAALGLYLIGIQLALIEEDKNSGGRKEKLWDNRNFFMDQLATGDWNEADIEDLLRIINGYLAQLDKGEAARLGALCSAVSLRWTKHLPRLQAWETTLRKLRTGRLYEKHLNPDPDLLAVLISSPTNKGLNKDDSWQQQIEALREERSEDWTWLQAQILLNQADVLLDQVEIPEDAEPPKDLIHKAVDILHELKHELQIRQQGLYGKWAFAYLRETETLRKPSPSGQREDLLQQALVYAQKGVEWNPQGPVESFVLGRVYAAMGDWRQATAEWERTFDLGPAPGASAAIAASYYPELATRADRRALPPVDPERIHRFLFKALALVESNPLTDERDLGQVEAHACLHFCIGRSYFARKQYEQAIEHLTIARNLGFRPIETRIALADALLAGRQVSCDFKAQYELEEATALAAECPVEEEKKKHLDCIEEVRALLPAGSARQSSKDTRRQGRESSVTRASAPALAPHASH